MPSAQHSGPSTAPRPREFDIDPFRGVVCLSLVVLHFYQNGPMRSELEQLLGRAGIYAIMHLRLGVESFFVLAGFMMAHMLRPVAGESVSITGYLKRRFFRLIMPFWIAVLLAALDRWAIALVTHTSRGGPNLAEVLSQLTLSREFFGYEDAAPGYWSMISLEQFYLLFLGCLWVCWRLFGKSDGQYGPAERALAALTCTACIASAAVISLRVPTLMELPQFGIYLTLGLMLYWAARQGFAWPHFIAGLIALAAVVASTFGELSRPGAALFGVAALYYLCKGHRLPRIAPVRWLGWCGQRSYSIYLIHAIVGIRVLSLVRFAPETPWVTPLLFVAAFVASLVAAELFFRFVERPWQERARKVDYRGRAGGQAPGPALAAPAS